jgi:hypothetical protein
MALSIIWIKAQPRLIGLARYQPRAFRRKNLIPPPTGTKRCTLPVT